MTRREVCVGVKAFSGLPAMYDASALFAFLLNIYTKKQGITIRRRNAFNGEKNISRNIFQVAAIPVSQNIPIHSRYRRMLKRLQVASGVLKPFFFFSIYSLFPEQNCCKLAGNKQKALSVPNQCGELLPWLERYCINIVTAENESCCCWCCCNRIPAHSQRLLNVWLF